MHLSKRIWTTHTHLSGAILIDHFFRLAKLSLNIDVSIPHHTLAFRLNIYFMRKPEFKSIDAAGISCFNSCSIRIGALVCVVIQLVYIPETMQIFPAFKLMRRPSLDWLNGRMWASPAHVQIKFTLFRIQSINYGVRQSRRTS